MKDFVRKNRECNSLPEQKAKELGVPVIPKKLPLWKEPLRETNPVVAICGECGLEIRHIMMYSCPKINCPVQPKARL